MLVCEFCGDSNSYHLDQFEQHCYLKKETHREATLQQVRDDAMKSSKKVIEEFKKDINNVIRAKHEREDKARMAIEKADQEKIAKTLPYVPRQ